VEHFAIRANIVGPHGSTTPDWLFKKATIIQIFFDFLDFSTSCDGGDVLLKQADRFIQKVQELEDANRLTPVIYDDGVSYLYVQVRLLV